ncbi:MAG: hypothetical protein COA66_00080 [Arcobacter sp.]|nr:MAG: hypothetical protein COA66_00080 [Arcobacter sp.]
MLNKFIILCLIQIFLYSNNYSFVYKSEKIKDLSNKKIALISNIGNIFTSYEDNPMYHKRQYHVVETWENDKYILSNFTKLLKQKNISNVVIEDNLIFSLYHDHISPYNFHSPLLMGASLIEVRYNDRVFDYNSNLNPDNVVIKNRIIDLFNSKNYDVIIYIEKLSETARWVHVVNGNLTYNTVFGLQRTVSAFFDNTEYITSNFVFNVISKNKNKIQNTKIYINSANYTSEKIWTDPDKKIPQSKINSLENDIKNLFLINLKNFISLYIK